jgi:hypothetical protein
MLTMRNLPADMLPSLRLLLLEDAFDDEQTAEEQPATEDEATEPAVAAKDGVPLAVRRLVRLATFLTERSSRQLITFLVLTKQVEILRTLRDAAQQALEPVPYSAASAAARNRSFGGPFSRRG